MREYKLRSLRQERELKMVRGENKHLTEQNRDLTELVTNLEEETVHAPQNQHRGGDAGINQNEGDRTNNDSQPQHAVDALKLTTPSAGGDDSEKAKAGAEVSATKRKLFVTDVDDDVARATEQLEKRNELLRAHVQSGADARKEDSGVIQDLVMQVCRHMQFPLVFTLLTLFHCGFFGRWAD